MRVGIIGGGAAGLAAAYYLTEEGHYAEVFERAPFLGGQASTFPVGGGQLERGYHHLFVSDVDMVELIHELGLGDKLAWLESNVGLFQGGRIWDFNTPMDLLRFKPLSLLQRIRVGLWTLYLQKTRNWRKFEGVTAKDWTVGHMGRQAYQVIWEPLLRGKFGEFYEQIGMTWLWGKIYLRVASRGKGMQKERLGYPMGSFGEVFDVLGERVVQQGGDVHISAGVRKVVVEEGTATGLEVELAGKEPETFPERFNDALCEMGRFGQKTSRGYYIYPEGSRTGEQDPEVLELAKSIARELGFAATEFDSETILKRLWYAVVNEGARILDDGIAIRPCDIDIVYINGYGFPETEGGPMFWADRQGLDHVLADIKAFKETYGGEIWEPAPLLERLVAEGKAFSSLQGS